MICIGIYTKENDSVKTVCGVMVLVLCILSDYALNLSRVFVQVSQRISELQTQRVGSTLGWSQFTKGHNSIKTVDWVGF